MALDQYNEDAYRSQGYSETEIAQDKARVADSMSKAGYSDQELAQYFGAPKEADFGAAKELIQKNIEAAKRFAEPAEKSVPGTPPPADPNEHPAKNWVEAFEAGMQTSVSGLAYRNKLPDMVVPEDAGRAMKIMSNVGALAGDAPWMYLGAGVGAIAGSEVPVVGNVMGAAAGGWAAPAALRKMLIDQIQKGGIQSTGDFCDRLVGTTWEAMKGATTGIATVGTGGVASEALADAGASTFAQGGARLAAELGTMTTVSKALENQLPKVEDFIQGAFVLAGMHGVLHGKEYVGAIKGKLQSIYAETGAKPEDVIQETQKNPVLKQELLDPSSKFPDSLKPAVEPDSLPVDYQGKINKLDEQIKAMQQKVPSEGQEKAHEEAYTQLINERDELTNQWIEHKKAQEEAAPSLPKTQDAEVPPALQEKSNVLGEGFDPKDQPQVPKTPDEAEAPKASGGGDEPPSDDPKSAILGRVGEEGPKAKMSWSDIYTKALDGLNPVRKLVDTLTGKTKLPASQDPYVLARLAKASTGMAETFVNQGPRDFATKKATGTPGLKQILAPFRGDLDGFNAYAIASRAIELESRGIKSGVPLDKAKEYVEANKHKYEEGFQKLVDFQNETLQYLKDSGILSDEAHAQILENNKRYVPFTRITEEGEAGGKGRGSLNPIKAIYGSDLKIQNPIESIIQNTHAYIALAERNRAMTSMVDLANKTEGGSALVERVPTPIRPVEVQPEEVAKFMADHGIQGDPDSFTIFRAQAEPVAKDEIAIMRDGKREVYNVGEPVATALKGTDYQPSTLMKVASLPARMIRTGAVETADFLGRHFIRDQVNAFVLSSNGYVPVWDAIKGLHQWFTEGKAYQDWLANGGGMSNLVSLDRDYIQNEVFKLSKDTGLIDKTVNLLKNPLQIFQAAAEAITSAPRIGEFMRAEANGKDATQAAYDARNVTIDNQRKGSAQSVQALSMITAFWNTHIQGVDRLVQAFQENPTGTAQKLALAITLPSVLLWWANKDDERYQNLPRWEKDSFWHFMTKDNVYRIPKPFEQGILFGAAPERFLQEFYEHDPKAFEGFGSALSEGAIPNPIPNAFMPAIEQFANRSWLTGGSLVPHQLEEVAPAYQYTPYTSETAKQLGKMISYVPGLRSIGPGNQTLASPLVIQNYVRSWGGSMGMYALQIADKALEKAGVVNPPPPRPTDTLSDIPFIKAFVVRYPSAQAQPIQDFYDDYKQAQTRAKTVQTLIAGGDPKAAHDFMASDAGKEHLLQLTGIEKALSAQSKMVRSIYANPDMSPNDKRQLIDGLYNQMIQAAKTGNQMMQRADEMSKNVTR